MYEIDSIEAAWNSGRAEEPNLGHKPSYKAASSHKPARRQHARYWTRSGIIGALHRHGIYW